MLGDLRSWVTLGISAVMPSVNGQPSRVLHDRWATSAVLRVEAIAIPAEIGVQGMEENQTQTST